MKSNEVVIKVEDLDKSFKVLDGEVKILKKISFEIFKSEFAIIYGPSGCGKSTLLHTILGLEPPTGGRVVVLGKDLYQDYSEDGLADFRKNNIGMVYQQSNWVKSLNVIENVALPLTLLGVDRISRIENAKEMLNSLQMLNWAYYKPTELSSGQQQKVSLARALITDPEIIIADEPTGNLDFESGNNLLALLKNFNEQFKKTIVMVTHDLMYLSSADKAIKLFDGQVQKIYSPQTDQKEMEINSFSSKKVWA